MDKLALRVAQRYAQMQQDEEASISRPGPMAEQEPVAVAPPGWENTVKKMKKHPGEIDNPWALAWHMKNKGDKPGGKEASGSPHELREMEEILKEHGYDPKDAKKLQDEGMGTHELEHRIKSTKPGEMGSLEYTHRLKKMAGFEQQFEQEEQQGMAPGDMAPQAFEAPASRFPEKPAPEDTLAAVKAAMVLRSRK